MVHCTLPVGAVSLTVSHVSVDEMWYVLSGKGKLWRSKPGTPQSMVINLEPGLAISIARSTHFQFKNTGKEALTLVIAQYTLLYLTLLLRNTTQGRANKMIVPCHKIINASDVSSRKLNFL